MVFYTLRHSARSFDDESKFYQFEKVLAKRGDFPTCPHCGTPIGVKVWANPFHVKLKGDEYGDMCRGSGEQFLLSYRFVQAWHDSNLTGLHFSEAPVALRPWHKLKETVPEYFVAFPVHTLTWLDERQSGLQIEKLVGCEGCHVAQRKRIDRLRIDEKTWQGQDIFYPSGLYGVLVVTQQFKDFIDANLFTNFPLVHQDNYAERTDENMSNGDVVCI